MYVHEPLQSVAHVCGMIERPTKAMRRHKRCLCQAGSELITLPEIREGLAAYHSCLGRIDYMIFDRARASTGPV